MVCRSAVAVGLLACSTLVAAAPRDRVLILLAEGFNSGEYWAPQSVLAALGYRLDVAGIQQGAILVTAGKATPEKDAQANLALRDVNVDDYLGLVIPGGYSPGNLEKDPASLEICRKFLRAGKPVSAICHGPRLLIRAGAMHDRVGTCLASVANELADEWKRGAYGKYLDQAVVVDRNLVTSRYPGDINAFSAATVAQLEAAGGLSVPKADASVLLIASSLTPNQKWLLGNLAAIGIRVRAVAEGDLSGLLKGKDYAPRTYDAIALAVRDLAKVKASAELATLLADLKAPAKPVELPEGDAAAMMRQLVVSVGGMGVSASPAPSTGPAQRMYLIFRAGFHDRVFAAADCYLRAVGAPLVYAADQTGWVIGKEGWPVYASEKTPRVGRDVAALEMTPAGAEVPEPIRNSIRPDMQRLLRAAAAEPRAYDPSLMYTAAIALSDGFDDYVFAAMYAYLGARGKAVILVGPARGDLRGLNGMTVKIQATYDDPIKLSDAAIVVATGGLWPQKAAARQATQPAWIEQQDQADQKHLGWLLGRLNAGNTLAVLGFDSLRLGRHESFKGKKFACSDQAVWSFGKDGGSYTGEPAVLTDAKLVTGKGASTVGQVLRMLDELQK
jgi:protease I